MAALARAHPPEEEEVLAAVGVHRVRTEVERVVAVRHPGKIGLRLALVQGDRDQPDLRRHLRERRVQVAVGADERSVNGVDDGCLERAADGGGQRPGVVVDDVELAGALEARKSVSELSA